MKIVALVGSNAKFSYNRELLKFIQKHYIDNYEIKLAEIKNIPLRNLMNTWCDF
ncbi:MAG: NAD(P)H-dependent oxidoreductase, partial [Lactobacillus iners]|nr:NAD(P)H-dependent oxidoreductase [Lactobacillus iners]